MLFNFWEKEFFLKKGSIFSSLKSLIKIKISMSHLPSLQKENHIYTLSTLKNKQTFHKARQAPCTFFPSRKLENAWLLQTHHQPKSIEQTRMQISSISSKPLPLPHHNNNYPNSPWKTPARLVTCSDVQVVTRGPEGEPRHPRRRLASQTPLQSPRPPDFDHARGGWRGASGGGRRRERGCAEEARQEGGSRPRGAAWRHEGRININGAIPSTPVLDYERDTEPFSTGWPPRPLTTR